MKISGFTIIELVVVIVILGVLAVTAAPKFLNITTDAHVAKNNATGAAFKSAIQLVHFKAMILSSGRAANDLQIFGNDSSGQLDINANGFPVQQYFRDEENPQLNNGRDCEAVWNTILDDAPTVSNSADSSKSVYQATYIKNDQCLYKYNLLPTLSIYYDSRNGQVIIDNNPDD